MRVWLDLRLSLFIKKNCCFQFFIHNIFFKQQISDVSLSQNERQIEDNLSRECVTYFCPGHLNKHKDRKLGFTTKAITYLTFSPDGSELLVNMGSEQIYLYDISNARQPVVRIEKHSIIQTFSIRWTSNQLSFQYLSMPQFNKSFDATEDDSSQMPIDLAEPAPEAPSTSCTTPTEVVYKKLSKLPQHIDEMKRSGNEYMENEKYLKAISKYSECIKLLPSHPVFYLNRATAYMRRNWFGDMYAGLRDCQMALKLDPTYVKAHFRLARALFELGFVMEASECLDELKKRFPNDASNKQIQLLAQDIKSHIEVKIKKTIFYS